MYFSDFVAVQINNRAVRQNTTDDVSVRISNQTVFTDIP